MSYPKTLDEYTDLQLAAEIERREKLRASGKCDYCERSNTTEPCQFPTRHHRDVVTKR